MSDTISMLKPYGIAIVAEHKEKDSKEIKVTPIETLGFFDGEIKSDPQMMEIEGVDVDGQAYKMEIETDNIYVATWLQIGTNRATAPDVRKGERVMLYKFADADKYYWQPTGMDDELRKQETVLLAISAKSGDADHTLTKDNTYFLEISAHNKKITLSTSQDMGEPHPYIVQINTGEGYVHIHDDIENEILLDSVNHHLKLHNADETLIELDKENINVFAKDTISVKAEQNVLVEANKLLRLKVGSQRFTLTPDNIRMHTSDFDAIKV